MGGRVSMWLVEILAVVVRLDDGVEVMVDFMLALALEQQQTYGSSGCLAIRICRD